MRLNRPGPPAFAASTPRGPTWAIAADTEVGEWEPRRSFTDAEEDEVRAVICARIGARFRISITYHDEIPKGPGGKYEAFKSELAALSEDGAA